MASPPPPAPPPAGPIVAGPGVLLIDTYPPPDERVYVYDPGYPPGTYFYGNYYYYGGYRYQHDVFVNRVVTENIRVNRYTNVTENRNMGQRMATQQRQQYARTGPRGPAAGGGGNGRINPNMAHTSNAAAPRAVPKR